MTARYTTWCLAACAIGAVLSRAQAASASDLTLTVGGRVSVELLSSDAVFHNTLSVTSPSLAVAATGCRLELPNGLLGVQLMSEKSSQHGCRVDLDANPATPDIDPFPAGTVLRFSMCAQEDADPACEDMWSSDSAGNSDNFDHVRTTPLLAADFPNRIFQLGWEDKPNGGDQDFNDLVAVVRVDVDSDGDGLWDDWERFGADTDGNGTVDLDLPGLGADPNHKDIFVEIDWMDCAVAGGDCAAGDTHNHRPKDAAITAAINAFAQAPILNPDGTTGINLHVERSNATAHQNLLNINGFVSTVEQASAASIQSSPTQRTSALVTPVASHSTTRCGRIQRSQTTQPRAVQSCQATTSRYRSVVGMLAQATSTAMVCLTATLEPSHSRQAR